MNMKKMVSIMLSLVCVSSLSLVAFATIKTVGGGRWDYGVNHTKGATCWSYYLHNQLRHGSTAENGDGDSDYADGIDAGEESHASVGSTDHGNKAFWHRCGIDKKCGYTQD